MIDSPTPVSVPSSDGPIEPVVPGAQFRYIRPALCGIAIVCLAVVLTARCFVPVETLAREGGALEWLSCVCWAAAILGAMAIVMRWRELHDRMVGAWFGMVALLALLRELDLHHALEPEQLGGFGMHLRIDWWLDGEVSLAAKAAWLIIFAVVGAVLVHPFRRGMFPVIQLARRGEPMAGFLVLAIVLSLLGAGIDDQLREATFVSKAARRIIEETSELLGSVAFAVSVWLHWWFPLAVHRRSAGLSATLPAGQNSA